MLITVSVTVETRSQGSGREQVEHVEDGSSRGRCASPRGKAEPHSSSPSLCLSQKTESRTAQPRRSAPSSRKGLRPGVAGEAYAGKLVRIDLTWRRLSRADALYGAVG